ncbi:hypothetical protein GCM10007301_54340 [Azorhizobium oxalatiphilum]|uniref:Uncharacterized protein n=1 Tax=Azorhizobium oxalatiphilum TaxID=980631 RepID=A0A917CH33_9HYPH|nr:hypothetical protein [Azorhizobium oxalatiphilum]GGF87606.1 hypothetical protein GCM10007301_54340 [Azorhizobium oxalatiphilum]
MRTMTYAALALAAGLAFSGAASADEYISQANRDNYALSAQGHFPGAAAASQSLLPANAQATVRFAPQGAIQAPAADPHWGPAMEGTPSRL